jgi:polar amino acid transport system permease protein
VHWRFASLIIRDFGQLNNFLIFRDYPSFAHKKCYRGAKLGIFTLSRTFHSVIESWRDLILAPGGARGEVSPPTFARVLNSLFALFVLIGIVWFSLASLHLDWAGVWTYRVTLFEGWLITLGITAAALVLSTVSGFIFALCQRSFFLPLRYFARFLIETLRCIPLLALIYLVWYGLEGTMAVSNDYRLVSGILILTLFESAYISEIFRAGIESVGKTQIESARAIGFTRTQTYRYVIIPQAFRQVLPPLVGQLVSLIKDSSLLSVIAIPEFTQSAQQVSSINYDNLETYFALAVGYLVLTVPISLWSRWLERRFKYET